MTSGSEALAPRTTSRFQTAASVTMLLLWLAWAATAWWAAPRESTLEQLRGDLAAGNVTSYSRAGSWIHRFLWAAPTEAGYRPDGRLHIWTTANGQVRYAESSSFAADVTDRSWSVRSPAQTAARMLGLVLVIGGLGVLIGGPVPARGTRWFWFWVGQIPLGLGYLAWLLSERPWTEPRRLLGGRRESGLAGFALMVVGAIVVSLLTLGAQRLLGGWLVPV